MKRITVKGLMSLGILTFLFTASSFAQNKPNKTPQPQKTVAEIFKESDLNEDNKLSKEEVKEPLKKNFEEIDLNEDGFISREELQKYLKPEGNKPTE